MLTINLELINYRKSRYTEMSIFLAMRDVCQIN